MTEEVKNMSYSTGVTTSMRMEALVNNEMLADITFIVGPNRTRIVAHKLLLVTASEYFHTMFLGQFIEAGKHEVVLVDDDPVIFQQVMRFIYCGAISITFENLRQLHACGQKYLVTDLIDLLSQFVEKQIDPERALRVFNENRYLGFPSVDEKCLQMICRNPLFYFNHVDLKTIDFEAFRMIIASKRLNCTDDQLHMALDIWGASEQAASEKVASEEAASEEVASAKVASQEVAQLKNLVDEGKRSYNCSMLRLFGQTKNRGNMTTDLYFVLDSAKPVSLYGIGVFIRSKSQVVTAKLTIFQGDVKIVGDTFEVTNKYPNTVHVADLFFEEIVLLPSIRYKITLDFSHCNDSFVLTDPRVHHNSIDMRFLWATRGSAPIAIAHMYCEENLEYNLDHTK